MKLLVRSCFNASEVAIIKQEHNINGKLTNLTNAVILQLFFSGSNRAAAQSFLLPETCTPKYNPTRPRIFTIPSGHKP